MLHSDRRTFLGLLSSLAGWLATRRTAGREQQPIIELRPTALFQQPEGRKNLVRVTVAGLNAPAARATVTDRHGALVGTAGLLPSPPGNLSGEVWVPLSEPADFQIDVDVARARVARRRLRLTPAKRWTLYVLSSIHTDVGYTDLQERALEVHRKNLDEALAWTTTHRDFHFTAECALQVLSYVENRSPEAADALLQAIRDGKIGWQALFANMLTGILDHDTFARLAWPAGKLARERGLTFFSAQITDVPGQTLTLPMLLAASGVKYLASGPNPERAVPLLPPNEGGGVDGTAYPQLYYWESPDGSRVLHWRAHHYGDGTRFGFDIGPDEMGHRLSSWLLEQPALQAASWPYDIALLYGADWQDNALMKEAIVANIQEFGRRFTWPRLIPGRAEDFFRDIERRYATKIPVKRGDTGLYWEDGAASTAAELAVFRSAQLAARAAEILALWDDRTERDDEAVQRRRTRADGRTAMWRDLLLFGEHTWGAAESISAPTSRQTVAQWEYKKRFIDAGAAAARDSLNDGLLRLGRASRAGRGRVVFNAGTWERTDVARVAGGAGKSLSLDGHDFAMVDFENGDALALCREVPPLGYLALAESDREPRPPVADGEALDAKAGGFAIQLDSGTGAIRSLVGPDGRERVKPIDWSGLNQLIYVLGGEHSALWTSGDRDDLKNPAQLQLTQAKFVRCKRERLPGIGVRLVVDRALDGFPSITSTVTLYDELPWIDIENRMTKTPTLAKEALYIAFPFAFTKPTVEVEVPLGRMTVERDQQPGSCRDWYCHAHWVWFHELSDGVLWSGPDTPLLTLGDLFRGQWRRSIVPDGTLFAYAMNNYWHTNYAASQGGSGPVTFRFRISLLAPGDAAEPVRRGWAACDPLYVSPSYTNDTAGPLIAKDRALFYADKNALIVGAKPSDDGEGAIVKILDVAGQARSIGVWPAAYTFKLARHTNLVEQNRDAITVAGDGRASIDLAAWGVAAARLFTPAEGS